MCGHVGVYGRLTDTLFYCFEDLLNLDLMRGTDSTGIAFIKADHTTAIHKQPVLPYELMRLPPYRENLATPNIGLIGHNRFATKGAVNGKNAHPFKHGHITLAHNGTLSAQWRLPDHKDFDTDSENLCYAINKIGIEETWKLTDGAATLVYWDDRSQTLNFISNDKRPFHFAWVDKGRSVIWSSDEGILKNAISRNDIKLAGKGLIMTLTKDQLFTMKVGKKELIHYVTKDLEPFKDTYVSNREKWERGMHMGFFGGHGYVPDEWDDKVVPIVTAKEAAQTFFPPSNKQKAITEQDFKKTYTNCAFCDISLANDFLTCTIMDSQNAACEDCTRTAALAEMSLEQGVKL